MAQFLAPKLVNCASLTDSFAVVKIIETLILNVIQQTQNSFPIKATVCVFVCVCVCVWE